MSCRAVIFDLFYTIMGADRTAMRGKARAVVEAAGIAPEDWQRAWGAGRDDADRGVIPSLLGRVRGALADVGYEDANGWLADELTGLLLAGYAPTLYADSRGALAEARERGYRLGLVSNLSCANTHWLREFELDRCFDALVLSCEVGMVKPEEGIYLLAAERLGVKPEGCVFVDDMLPYLAGAKQAGMTAVRIDRRDSSQPPQGSGAEDCAADLCIANLRQLLEWLPPRAAATGTG